MHLNLSKSVLKIISPASLLCLLGLFLPLGTAKHFIGSYSYVNGYFVDYLAPAFYVSEFLVWGVILSTLWKKRRSFSLKRAPRLFHLVGFFVVICFLAVNFYQANNSVAWGYRFYRLLEAFLLFKASAVLLRDKAIFKRFRIFLGGGVLWGGALGILQFFLQRPLFGYLPLGEAQFQAYNPAIAKLTLFGQIFVRAYSGFPHPNVFAAFLVVGLLVFFLRGITPRPNQGRVPRAFMAGVPLVGAAALTLTFSRAGIMALGGSLAFLKLGRVRPSRKRYIAAAGAILFLGLGLLATPRFSASLKERLLLADLALSLWRTHPWFGVGLNQFSSFASQFKFQPAHNIFLLGLAEGGLLGAALGACFLKKFLRGPFFPQGAFLICLLVFGLLDHFLLTTYQGITLFSLTLGVVSAYTRYDGTASSSKVCL